MRIAITGAGGFIGRALAARLARQGHEILALDNDFRGSLASLSPHPALFAQPCDVLVGEEVERAFKNVDAVYHLAAINGTENFYKIPHRVLEVGIIGTHNVLKAALKNGVERFYFASSSEVYGTAAVIPTPETVLCQVADVFNARSSYGVSKLAGELMTINYLRGSGAQFVIFRPHNVYGPEMGNEHVIPQLVRKAMAQIELNPRSFAITIPLQGMGGETRAFVYIDDAVRGIELATLHNPESGLIHVGAEEETAIRDLAVRIGRLLGVELKIEASPLLQGSPSRRCPDTTKLRGLGFVPKVSLQEGLEKTVGWYADHYRRKEGL